MVAKHIHNNTGGPILCSGIITTSQTTTQAGRAGVVSSLISRQMANFAHGGKESQPPALSPLATNAFPKGMTIRL
jgi:hypothetical protein